MAAPIALSVVLYAGGYIAQFAGNYAAWQQSGGVPGDGTSPALPSASPVDCIAAVFTPPYGIYGIFVCVGFLALLVVVVMKLGWGDKGEYDRERNLIYSRKGTYGTAGFMTEREMNGVLDLVPDIRKHHGTILGEIDMKAVCVPEDSRMNRNIAVYGASGSKKTRAFCVNMVFQCAARGESLLISDPKSEIYEKCGEYLRNKGYVVKLFNLVSPENSDSWNCLAEIEGQELTAQLFCDVVIKNTGSERGDHFWDNSELNLLKALVLYVEQGYPPEEKNIGQVYKLLTLSSENELNALFDTLPVSHPAKAPYSIFRQASESVRGGIIIGLGSRLQVFQNKLIRLITSRDEIDLELPGKQKCAYFCITSDQDSTFDFLCSLFISFFFIKLVRYADKHCKEGKLPVPVHFLGEELVNCGVIPDLSRKISVIRSRNISMSCVFQNLAGLQNRYPYNQWQEILGNCDVQLFLGCTDELTAKFISDRSGEASIQVTSKAKQLGTWRISDYTPEYRETSGVGKRKVLTMDEVLRLPVDKALVVMRGQKILQADKYD
ncbi:MAG: type IV secretory system conjugative DNA transfer family protein, partial [Oscillospiraceae bacterium]|nr:type IV secretory system conjugative DNA transfer family protein [Oscillospiraceae bacterium]